MKIREYNNGIVNEPVIKCLLVADRNQDFIRGCGRYVI